MGAAVGNPEPRFLIEHRKCQCDQAPRVPLFTWVQQTDSGDIEAVFEMPEYFEAHVALDYLEMLHTQGDDAAFRWALIKALGQDGWNAVRSPGMDSETFQGIVSAVLTAVMGSLRSGPKGRLKSVT
jgi:hypothetical protein